MSGWGCGPLLCLYIRAQARGGTTKYEHHIHLKKQQMAEYISPNTEIVAQPYIALKDRCVLQNEMFFYCRIVWYFDRLPLSSFI